MSNWLTVICLVLVAAILGFGYLHYSDEKAKCDAAGGVYLSRISACVDPALVKKLP